MPHNSVSEKPYNSASGKKYHPEKIIEDKQKYTIWSVTTQETNQIYTLIDFVEPNDQKIQAVFQELIRISKIVSSPYIAIVSDYGRNAHNTFLVMEQILGVKLVQWATTYPEKLTEYQCLQFFRQLALIVHELNQRGVKHGNINLQSLYVVSQPSMPQYGDYGLRLWDLAFSEISNEINPLQAPEMVSDEAQIESTDIYSIAALIYRLLAKRDPYETTGLQLMQDIVNPRKQPALLHQLNEDVSQLAVELIESCMHKNPRKRPSADRLAKVIDEILQGSNDSSDYQYNIATLAAKNRDYVAAIKAAEHGQKLPGGSARFDAFIRNCKKLQQEIEQQNFDSQIKIIYSQISNDRLKDATKILDKLRNEVSKNKHISSEQHDECNKKLNRCEKQIDERRQFHPAFLLSVQTDIQYDLNMSTMTIGRAKNNKNDDPKVIHISLAGEEPERPFTVSRIHANFVFEEGKWFFSSDPGATNDSFIRKPPIIPEMEQLSLLGTETESSGSASTIDEKIEADECVELEHGDTLILGKVALLFQIPAQPPIETAYFYR